MKTGVERSILITSAQVTSIFLAEMAAIVNRYYLELAG